ncbi:MAG: hypothetical protein HZA84_05015 [Thaumarchaeota archaeon]|nr:hypothetical protein [Nitrososphaerota archaeon]
MASGTTESRVPSAAFALSLASGVIIIFWGIMPWLFLANFQASPMDGMMGGMMGGGWGAGHWFIGGWLFPLSLVAGAMILFGAIMMNARPQETRIWGVIVLVFSIVGFTGMGFSILGAILGIIGSIIALGERNGR